MFSSLPVVLADWINNLHDFGLVAQSFAAILTGLIAVLGVPLALRQVVNLQREQRRTEADRQRRLDAEANLNITADYTLSHTAAQLPPDNDLAGAPPPAIQPAGAPSQPPPSAAQPGKRVLRMDLTLENVGEGTVDVLACLVAARELQYQGDEVVAEGRDAQWDDLTRYYWNAGDGSFSPGLSTTKHIVYAPDALARVKARSRKTLARVDQVLDFRGEVYLLYRVFVAARRASRSIATLQDWTDLQRALLNINAPAFREASGEDDPLGRVATPDGWRLFLHHFAPLANAKLPLLRRQADQELRTLADPAEYARASARLDAELQEFCRRELLPAWHTYRNNLTRLASAPHGFDTLLANKRFRNEQREIERRFPWEDQELWVEYFYVTLEAR